MLLVDRTGGRRVRFGGGAGWSVNLPLSASVEFTVSAVLMSLMPHWCVTNQKA